MNGWFGIRIVGFWLLLAGLCGTMLSAQTKESTTRVNEPAAAQIRPEHLKMFQTLNVSGNIDYAEREKNASPEIKQKLEQLRRANASKKRTFTVGYTTALDIPLEQLTGAKVPKISREEVRKINVRGEELAKIDMNAARIANFPPVQLGCHANAESFDWRSLNKVTPVKLQLCGTCWDFTAMGAYEGSYAIRNSALIDASEQYNLNCAHAGNCGGGWWMPVFDMVIAGGTATEASDPFTGNDMLPCPTVGTPYRASAWGFVGAGETDIPSPALIKQALCQHGPLATAVMADGNFVAYTGGVFDEHDEHFPWINHGITIIGWDDSKGAWLIKNSWGTGWGIDAGGSTKGYMWIAYNTNNIGIATAWVDAASIHYKLPIDWYKFLEREKIIVKPIEIREEVVRPEIKKR